MILGGVVTVLVLLAGSAPPASQPDAPSPPPPRIGRFEFSIDTPSPIASAEECNRRFRWIDRNKPPRLDVSKETFQALVPETYAADGTWGVLVWASPSETGFMCPQPWHEVLAKHKLLWVGADNAGNQRHSDHRVRLAVEAALWAQRNYRLDPGRVYVAGFSGGGKVAGMCGNLYSDVFTGAFSICGITYHKGVPTGLEKNKFYPPTYPPPVGPLYKAARERNRHVLLTGDEDFNLNSTRQTHRLGYEKDRYARAVLLIVPGLAHALPDAEWFDRGLEALDRR